MTEYFIPTGASETELVEKRSRFLGHVWPVESEGEARARIEEIRKKHYDARHHCWCYRIREGGVTGDVFGCTVECTEWLVLLTFCTL